MGNQMAVRLGKLRWAFYSPLTIDAPWRALNRFLKWQIARRIAGYGFMMLIPYVNDTKILV